MSAHTPGLLVAYGCVIRGCPDTSDESQIASALWPADARRLAACWNACELIDTDTLAVARPQQLLENVQVQAERNNFARELAAARALLERVQHSYSNIMDDEQDPLLFDIRKFLGPKP